MEFVNVTGVKIPEGEVTKITETDSGRVLWTRDLRAHWELIKFEDNEEKSNYYNHDGAGTAKNLEQAEYWLTKSFEHGNEFVQEFAPQALESIRAEKTGKAKTQSQSQPTQHSTPNNAEYKQMLQAPEFAKARSRRTPDCASNTQ